MCTSYNPFTLENKTILVTGATGGIGSAVAVECAKLGASLCITGRDSGRLEKLVSRLNNIRGGGNYAIACDLADEDEINNLAAQVPQLDGLVLNAGIGKLSPVKFIKKADFDSLLAVNMVAPALLLKELLKQKKVNDGGSVVFTASMAGKGIPKPGNAMYGASKSAVCSYAQFCALELAPRKIRVNTVCPGMVNTKMIAHTGELEYAKDGGAEGYPLGRYGEPEDIAKSFAFLLSDASSWITGTDLIIDGGLHLK